MAVDPARVKSLFLAAADLTDPAERAAYLDRECGEDSQLRARVEALLRANDAAPLSESQPSPATGDYVSDAPAAGVTAGVPRQDEQAGTVIAGKYTLVELIGEGGMGSVWRAKQTEPVKRFIAVKLIKAGMDSRQVLARFEAERQALALMDHPNIAKVFDGGLHEHRPFFVMELVKGVPITDFCDAHKLNPKERLEILRVVREEEPPRPSAKLSTADALPSLSANRGTEPKKLTGLLRQELDWIVMKALEKDRARRYETANGFAADVLRSPS